MATLSEATPQPAANPEAGSERETALTPAGHSTHPDTTAPGSSFEVDGLEAIPPALAGMPVGLSVAVPLKEFRVRHLLAMTAGEVIETQWGQGEDLPLGCGDVQLAWSEFEVVDTRLAVRINRLT